MRRIITLLALWLAPTLAAATVAQGDQACVREVVGQAPPPVAAYVRRRLTCMRWGGDEPITPAMARSPKTPAEIHVLHCDRLAPDEATLRRQFAHDHAALDALNRGNATIC